MPDGDKLPKGLPRRYAAVYEQLQQDELDYEVLAHRSMTITLREIRRGGMAAVPLILRVARELKNVPKEPMLRQLENWDKHKQFVEDQAASLSQDTRFTELAVEVCERQIDQLRYNEDAGDLRLEMFTRFIMLFNDARFDAFAKLPPKEPDGKVSQQEMVVRVEELRPHKEKIARKLAQSIVRWKSVGRVHMPPSPNAKHLVDDGEDLGASIT